MDAEMSFRFVVPRAPEGALIEMAPEEAEKMLLEELEAAEAGAGDPKEALWNLAQFYKVSRQHEKALGRLRELIRLLPDPESKAQCIFTMGQAMEQVEDFEAAAKYYREATALEPASPFTWYFIHNNLGYSLNRVGRYGEGELYCRRAIGIDPDRPNGHKNLGVALAGKGDYQGAARSFVMATRVNAADGRSVGLLEELIQEHPELEFEFGVELENCRAAVEFAAGKVKEAQPKLLKGWRRDLALWRVRINRWVKRWRR
jgi:tetratricopeptide (TPR) repeat protein